ncbi:unnamed protein product [Clavelina lepadiformis]|uniref:serine--tRNA ligase n=1 Tax=Clavelina lepadiformis TaxID=159417 RepID=A0ABP0F6L2_CLALP
MDIKRYLPRQHYLLDKALYCKIFKPTFSTIKRKSEGCLCTSFKFCYNHNALGSSQGYSKQAHSQKDSLQRMKMFLKEYPDIFADINEKFAMPYINLINVLQPMTNDNDFYAPEPTVSALYNFYASGEIHKPAIDMDYISKNKSEVEENMKCRKTEIVNLDDVVGLHERIVQIENQINSLKSKKKADDDGQQCDEKYSKFINMSCPPKDTKQLRILSSIFMWLRKELEKQYLLKALGIPNKTHYETPILEEVVLETVGEKPFFDYPVYDHIIIANRLKIMRQQRMANIAGHRNYFLYGAGSELEQAIVRFIVERLRKESFTFISAPNIMKDAVFEGSGLVSKKMHTMIYNVANYGHGNFCLAGTSEVPLCGFFSSHAISEKELPLKVCSVSTCYRKETGSRLDPKGLFRVHQFMKVEMFGLTANETGEESNDLLQEFVSIQKALYADLDLHFKVVNMPASDLGLPACRKIDIEAWFPGRNKYDEISSASNCTDFQSRRLHILYKTNGQYKFTHTINATAGAVPRLIVALLENGQQPNKEVLLPECLHSYMNGKMKLSKEKCKSLEYIGIDQSKKKQIKLS